MSTVPGFDPGYGTLTVEYGENRWRAEKDPQRGSRTLTLGLTVHLSDAERKDLDGVTARYAEIQAYLRALVVASLDAAAQDSHAQGGA